MASTAALALQLACGGAVDAGAARGLSRAVVSGEPAAQAEVGGTVALYFLDVNDTGCTGTLIAPRVVVTAAHCVLGVPATQLAVVVGALVPTEAPDDAFYAVVSAVPHPEFVMQGVPTDDPEGLSDERDVGVLVLDRDVEGVAPVPVLAQAAFDAVLTAGTPVTITGYGLTSDDWQAEFGRLYTAQTPFVRRTVSEMLAGGPGSPDTCNGDSGGPAYVDVEGVRTLAGITSRAAWIGDGACGNGGIYTLFGAFADFVSEASGGLWTGEPGSVDLEPPPPPPDDTASCEGHCWAASYDGTCFCDPLCAQTGDCCADFDDACADVPQWTCAVEELEDDSCDCDCGAPDFACAEDECAPSGGAGEGEGEGEGEGDSDDADGDAGAAQLGATSSDGGSCAASGAPWPLALALLSLRRRRDAP